MAQRVELDHAVLYCRPVTPATPCPECGGVGVRHDSVERRLAHIPMGWLPTILAITVPRYRCQPCGRFWRHDIQAAAPGRGKLSRDAVFLALKSIVLTPASRSWLSGNSVVAAARIASQHVFHATPRLAATWATESRSITIGVDEHVWRHTRHGDKYVTVIIDLTPTRTNTGPSRLLAVVEGRSKRVFKSWLEAQPQAFRVGVEIVAMDGFTGYKTAASEAIEHVTTVMDPFHVVALAGEKLDRCRQRIQQETLGHRGRLGDPLYGIRRVARTRASLLTENQQHRLTKVFADEQHVAFEVTWCVYQDIIDAYRARPPAEGKKIMVGTIDTITQGVPTGLEELRTLGRTMHHRRDDILAFFDHPRTSNGPTEAINGLLEHLRGTARGFRNHYIARSLLDAGGFKPLIHSLL